MEFPVVTSEEMAMVDEVAVESGLLVMNMMEYAGYGIAKFCGDTGSKRFLILAGKGHNGGDGIAAARHLVNWGYEVRMILANEVEALKEVSRHHYNLVEKMLEVKVWKDDLREWFDWSDVIVDSLIGYNIKGDPRSPFNELIGLANESGKNVIAVDIPSGLNGSNGNAYSPCIKASSTLTLALPKKGLLEEGASEFVGDLFVTDLGIPEYIYKKAGVNVPNGLFKTGNIQKIR